MDAVANDGQRVTAARHLSLHTVRLSHCCVRLGLLAAFGFLAFLFSVVSPYDDDIQQEFVQNNKARQLVVANYKARELRTSCTGTIPPALSPQTLPAIR